MKSYSSINKHVLNNLAKRFNSLKISSLDINSPMIMVDDLKIRPNPNSQALFIKWKCEFESFGLFNLPGIYRLNLYGNLNQID